MRHGNTHRHRRVTFALAVLLAGNAGCSTPFESLTSLTDAASYVPASVTVVASVPALVVGQSTKLSATVKDASGSILTDVTVTWSASNPSVASVSNDGTMNALNAGSVTIIAASGTAKGEAVITVRLPAIPPTTPPPSGAPSPATLPQLYDTGMPSAPATGGTIIRVGAADDLQAALDRANPGDVIELAAGAVFTGNYILRAKPGNSTSWIVIRSSGTLPVEGQRMTPALAAAAKLPRIQTPNSAPVFQTEPGSHHYRLVGLDITSVSSSGLTYSLIAFGTDRGGGQTTLATVPHNLVLDRVYLHGTPTLTLRRGVALNSASSAVIDSYISECHEKGADSQAIMGWNGPGPFKIVNNYLEGAGENIMFGGSDPGISGLIPSDIEIRRNHFYKPLAWRGVWSIKNLFELKNARRVLVEGNVMENNWGDAQDGTAILLKSTNQEGGCTWCGTSHVTFRLNIVRNVGAGFNIAANPEKFPVDPLHNISVTDNVVSNINVGDFKGPGRAIIAQGDVTDVSITHNTIYNETQPFAALVFGPVGAKTVRFRFSDNITATADNYGVFGDNVGDGIAAMTEYAPTGTMTGNVFAGNRGANYPAGNMFTPAVSDVGFTNVSIGDFSLLLSSPFKGRASDGRDPGADVSEVLKATNGAVQP